MPLFKLLRMDRLRRSLRESFRKKKDHVPECSKPHQWQSDEVAVRDGTCSFPVKYLGCVEVFESRGMQVCEEALKMLRNSRRRSIKGVLYVTGDGLRVVDDDTKGLIVDQTIEKVSFCAPDRNHEKGFSYICRDGTTRRWMCHGFLAVKDSGERLSHAVGCAFAACLERKQKRDKECGVTMTFDPNNSTFTRMGSFKQTTMTERMQDSQEVKPTGSSMSDIRPGLPPKAPPNSTAALTPHIGRSLSESVPSKPIHNPYAIERPHATPMMLQRQGSFRGFGQLNQTSPFKRQLSLRITDLPSNLERQQRSMSLESSEFSKPTSPVSPDLPSRAPRTRLHSLPNAVHSANMSPIPESSPVGDRQPSDSISAMCQQLAHGLTMLSNDDDPFSRPFGSTPASAPPTMSTMPMTSVVLTTQSSRNGVSEVVQESNPWVSGSAAPGPSRAEVWLSSNVNATCPTTATAVPQGCSTSSSSSGTAAETAMTSSAAAVTKSTSNPLDLFGSNFGAKMTAGGASVPSRLPPNQKPSSSVMMAPPRRAPHITHLRSQSLGAATTTGDQKQHPSSASRAAFKTAPNASAPQPATQVNSWSSLNGNSAISSSANDSSNSNAITYSTSGVPYRDPFDAEWAELAARTQPSTNPFSQNSVKAFEIHM